jgi:hypothetical protein
VGDEIAAPCPSHCGKSRLEAAPKQEITERRERSRVRDKLWIGPVQVTQPVPRRLALQRGFVVTFLRGVGRSLVADVVPAARPWQ